jgi:hypothetical protein
MAACASCGERFTCGLRESQEPCWCASLPPLQRIDPNADCLCPACLAARVAVEAAMPNAGRHADAQP